MTLKEDSERIGLLLHALYPGVFPPPTTHQVESRAYVRAVRENPTCGRRARALKRRLLDGLGGALESRPGDDPLALRLYRTLQARVDLWREAIELARRCENWSAGAAPVH